MSQDIDLKQADRKVFSASFDDGLVDIFIASFALAFALGPFTTRFLNPHLGDLWGDFVGTLMIFLPVWGMIILIQKQFARIWKI